MLPHWEKSTRLLCGFHGEPSQAECMPYSQKAAFSLWWIKEIDNPPIPDRNDRSRKGKVTSKFPEEKNKKRSSQDSGVPQGLHRSALMTPRPSIPAPPSWSPVKDRDSVFCGSGLLESFIYYSHSGVFVPSLVAPFCTLWIKEAFLHWIWDCCSRIYFRIITTNDDFRC